MDNSEEYYKMKYFKYKAKYQQELVNQQHGGVGAAFGALGNALGSAGKELASKAAAATAAGAKSAAAGASSLAGKAAAGASSLAGKAKDAGVAAKDAVVAELAARAKKLKEDRAAFITEVQKSITDDKELNDDGKKNLIASMTKVLTVKEFKALINRLKDNNVKKELLKKLQELCLTSFNAFDMGNVNEDCIKL
jgi:hypothetical protein